MPAKTPTTKAQAQAMPVPAIPKRLYSIAEAGVQAEVIK